MTGVSEALTAPDALTALISRLREALEQIIRDDQRHEWTATDDNPETHWVVRDGHFARIARQALSATDNRAPVEDGWRDIESAPKDGTVIIVGCWVIGEGHEPFWSAWTDSGTCGCFGCDGTYGDEPTHWMHVAAAPTPPTGSETEA